MLTEAFGSPLTGVVFLIMAGLLAYRVVAAATERTGGVVWRTTTVLRLPLLALTLLVGAAHWLVRG